jgi:hypothetical protein
LFSVSGSFRIDGAPSEIYAETMGGQIVVNAYDRVGARENGVRAHQG